MAIIVALQGNIAGDGFLVAPLGMRTFDATLSLKTTGGTASVTLQASPNAAGLVFSHTALSLSTTPTFATVHATAQSASRADTTIQVMQGATVAASFSVTAIANPVVHFRGRFQARFATQPAPYNENPFYTSTNDNVGYRWTWGLEGEPNFVPTTGNIPENLETPVGRVILFNNPVALRSHAAPVVTKVDKIIGSTLGGTEIFTTGDPVIGELVNLGPDTYFAGNRELTNPMPEEYYQDAYEPMGLFELHIGTRLHGASAIGPFTHKATAQDERTRVPDSRPIAQGLVDATDERTEFGLTASVASFSATRLDLLVADYDALPAGPSVERRNLARRIGHLLDKVGLPKRTAVMNAHPGAFIVRTPGTLDAGWEKKEVFNGKVDAKLQFQPADSSVITYLAQFSSFAFQSRMFSFHSDELCAHHISSLTAELSSGVPNFDRGVYNAQAAAPASFAPVTATGMTQTAISGLLGAAASQRYALTLSADLTRLVVARVTIVDDTLSPASWQIATLTDSRVCELIPELSTLYRDMLFLVLPPGHERNLRGACEGTQPIPPPTVGYARVWYDTASSTWRYLLHAGVPGGAGSTQVGSYAGSPATKVPGCTQPDLDLLTPVVDFGKVEQGMVRHRQILLLNRSAASITVTLPAIAAPFGAPGSGSVTIPAGTIGALLVSYTAGPPGPQQSLAITLTSTPVVSGSLAVTLYGDPESVAAVNVSLVLDRSGSMAERAFGAVSGISTTKAQLRNQAAQVFVDLLRPTDQIGMVRFNNLAAAHLPMTVAGDGSAGTGKDLAATALASADLNPAGSTAVGTAMVTADTMLGMPSPNQKAMVVLTDGKENVPPYIDAVTLTSSAKVYAIGIGRPDEVNTEKLDAITDHTGGYLLLTGDMGIDDEYRLHKYYTQILSGISGDQIVVDPRSVIGAGQTQRTRFYLGEADAHADIVLLQSRRRLEFWLEAPDGSVIDPNTAGLNAAFIRGRSCAYYRLRTPVFPGDPGRGHGAWNAVVRYPGDTGFELRSNLSVDQPRHLESQRDQPALTALFDPVDHLNAFAAAAQLHQAIATPSKRQADNVLSYNVVVRARSSLTMDVRLVADSMGLTATRSIVATVTAFGLPYLEPIRVVAEITGPDGSAKFVDLQPAGAGTYSAPVEVTGRRGAYQVVARAIGTAPGGVPLQRERSLTMPVIVPGSSHSPAPATGEPSTVDDSLRQAIENLVATLGQATSHGPRRTVLRWLLLVLLMVLVLIAILVVLGLIG